MPSTGEKDTGPGEMPGSDEPLPVLPLLPLRGFHAAADHMAARLPVGSWRTLMDLPTLHRGLGVATPGWVIDLWIHVGDLAGDLPASVAERLMSPRTIGAAWCDSAEAGRWGELTGLWAPSGRADGWMVLTPLGHAVRMLRARRERQRAAESKPYRRVEADEPPNVVEDGTGGVVVFKYETEDTGPAWLGRGDRFERLFRGRWHSRYTAEAYADRYGHDFESQ